MAKTINKNSRKKQALIRILIMAAILICVNVLMSYFHKGLDLTKEKRFTLSAPTVKLLKNMQEIAVIDIYLQNDHFPADIQRLHESVRERLQSFKEIAGNKIIFKFIDPFKGKDDQGQKQVVHDLQQKGIQPTELQQHEEDEYSMKLFVPFAFIQYNGKEMPIRLLEDRPGSSQAEKISYSEAQLEYKFANAINQMNKPDIARVAYMVGNGEPLDIHTFDMLRNIQLRYYLDTLDLNRGSKISSLYNAIIIVQPTVPFTGPEKLKIDQYVMHGGHVLMAVNSLNASLDSLKQQSQFMAMENNLDLDDLLYKYGVRINKDLVEDEQNLTLPRTMNDGQAQPHDWIYFPRLNPTSEHPIVRNMDFIRAGFTNSIDTIRASGIAKTVLLATSKHSLKADAPVRVSLSMMNFKPADPMFTKSYLPVAILLEGKFHSVFQNRLAPETLKFYADSLKQPFKAVCDSDGSIIVTSVGDIFTNGYAPADGIHQMGYYWGTHEYFANKDFLLNCVEYLTDNSGILEARSKESKLRLLDMSRAKDEKTKWQVVNTAIPIGIVLIFASAYFFFRKRRYEIKTNVVKTLPENA